MGVGPVALFARTRPELASPDVKFTISPFSADNPAKGLHDFSGFTLIGYQLRPDSRGELKLRSADPRDTPAMFPNYLSAENDRRTIVDSLKLCREFLATDHLRRFIESEYLPGPQRAIRRGLAWVRAQNWRDDIPSNQHLPHGPRPDGGGRRGVAGAWDGGAAGGGRLHHANGGIREHQRTDHHDRGKSIGHDTRESTARHHRVATIEELVSPGARVHPHQRGSRLTYARTHRSPC